MSMTEGKSDGLAGALGALREIQEQLSVHPGFQVVPVSMSLNPFHRTSRLGQLIKQFRFRKFGAEFDGTMTLLQFRLQRETPRRLVLDFQWHISQGCAGRSVFIHFLDASDEVRFYGDYALDSEAPDMLGFVYSQRRVEVPKDVPAGTYRVRLGVWRPAENKLLALRHFRGCFQESTGWRNHSVILHSVEIGEGRPVCSELGRPIAASDS